ncbi:MAG: hypothetical protein M3123_03815, partial [Actinomycetota bacterium]|nr:hypothetical protein [Actinomycetota bacterium]
MRLGRGRTLADGASRSRKHTLLLIGGLALLALSGGAASAPAAPLAEGGPDASPRGSACAGPCPVLVFSKGGGSGEIRTSSMVTTPQGVRCRPPCDFTVEDVET